MFGQDLSEGQAGDLPFRNVMTGGGRQVFGVHEKKHPAVHLPGAVENQGLLFVLNEDEFRIGDMILGALGCQARGFFGNVIV